MHETQIVGEAVAGEAAKLRRSVESAIKTINKSVFDVAELLGKIVAGQHYTKWGFNTRAEYFRSLDMSESKARYLTTIAEVMSHPKVNIPRKDYEPVGIGKLREITSLDPDATYTGPDGETLPMDQYIRGFIYDSKEQTLEDVQRHVRTLKGFVGENDQTHLNLTITRLVLEQVLQPAIEKMRLVLGPVGKDDDGMAIEASPSRCIELICANFLAEETDDTPTSTGIDDSAVDCDEPVSSN